MSDLIAEHFDRSPDRKSSGAMKWNHYDEALLPLWVADSDFKCAQPIIDVLQQAVAQGTYGYHLPSRSANAAVTTWLQRRHGWVIEDDWLVWLPGVVSAFNVACCAYSQPGDKVLVQLPNYKPLRLSPGINQRELAPIATVNVAGRWQLDLDDLERQAADPRSRLLLLCNPMNPCGSVLTAAELQRIASICLKHNVILCSDEIHCDLILNPDEQHIPAGSLPNIGEQSITIMAANKTFNVAGLSSAFAIIPDKKQRLRFQKTAMGIVPWANYMGVLATEAAFTLCDDWYQAQLNYLRGNRDYLAQQFAQLAGFEYQPAAATFLAWVDASGLGVSDVQAYMMAKGLAPSPGSDFGWGQFTRINFACPRKHLEQAIARLQSKSD
ncbi:PatB family C-S lyase [Dasania sp. GY-MA-18]|uniref:cysteine-S-conjugate beta-lyase n=1 Tax=Dasania phycosphaerae TaxID=2950436 RepID=A0A9J6RK86_9GAMM|nr:MULTISPECIES: PatB family C-S lyase [Dasania]MCR8922212.1 PatB family C-S lyase [Dasania sp. GY-MA-18]MCZ0864640.1 PatB family C-S lyase [Dasania phycosphaerae]MCZ0868368.1 PatB family C-S lyase [Dasania phycosphaerae]